MGHGISPFATTSIPGAGQQYMREVADATDVPIINMQCDIDHPTQALADLMTMRELFGKNLRGKKICGELGLRSFLRQASVRAPGSHHPHAALRPRRRPRPPAGIQADGPSAWRTRRRTPRKAGVKFEVTHDMDAAFRGADIVYPKSWGAFDLMTQRLALTSQDQMRQNEQECLKLNAKYKSWICDERRMKLAAKDAVYMHCLPADRGNEVTDAVIDGPQSVVFPEAENRLHTAKAIMASVMRERPF